MTRLLELRFKKVISIVRRHFDAMLNIRAPRAAYLMPTDGRLRAARARHATCAARDGAPFRLPVSRFF